jgi:hypothetical protein
MRFARCVNRAKNIRNAVADPDREGRIRDLVKDESQGVVYLIKGGVVAEDSGDGKRSAPGDIFAGGEVLFFERDADRSEGR